MWPFGTDWFELGLQITMWRLVAEFKTSRWGIGNSSYSHFVLQLSLVVITPQQIPPDEFPIPHLDVLNSATSLHKKGCCAHKTSLVKPLLLKLLFQVGEVSCHVFVGMGIHFPFCNNFLIELWSHLTVWYFPFFILFIYSSKFDDSSLHLLGTITSITEASLS
jgi:hypothetical protein